MFDRSIIKRQGWQIAVLAFTLGLVQLAGYYLAAAWVNGPGPMAAAQPDALLYCQSARRICEGFPFSFTSGTAVSSGTTSILYPFILAIPYALGITGQYLVSVGFLLNGIFYLVFLIGWAKAFSCWFKPSVAIFAAILLALCPQTSYCALAQSDIGLWMAVSGLLSAALATSCRPIIGFLLFLSPMVRPEGVLLIFAHIVIAIARKKWKSILLSMAGILGIAIVLGLNFHLTDTFGFSSVAQKGYFTNTPFAMAIVASATDFLSLLRDFVLGQASSMPRLLYFVPVLGAGAFVVGVMTRKWQFSQDESLITLVLAALGGLLIVAQSGWQGTNVDRYLAWEMPLLICFGAAGWCWTAQALEGFPLARYLPFLPMIFSIGASICGIMLFHSSCADTERVCRFAQTIDGYLDRTASVATFDWSGIAYFLNDRRVAHLSGIYSPEFSAKSTAGVLEILKNEPDTRFSYWVLAPRHPISSLLGENLGSCELVGPDGLELKKACWQSFDAAAKIPSCSSHRLVDRIDVGYEKDEKRAEYEQIMNYGMLPFKPLVKVQKLRGQQIIDIGRLIAGTDEMMVSNLEPGKDLLMTMRTISNVRAEPDTPSNNRVVSEYAFNDEIECHASVDGQEVTCCHAHIATNGFSDVTFKIPGSAITHVKHRIGLHGDHVTFGYWFYQ